MIIKLIIYFRKVNIYLTGFMGSGKSVYARQLSRELGKPAFDMDDIMEDLEGEGIYDIFYNKGEEYFRKLENEVLKDLVKSNKGYIIACGGGTPCFFNNMDLMQSSGVTIYLKASGPFLFDRLKTNRSSRPLIALYDNVELKAFIKTTLAERDSYYNKADIVVDIESITLPVFMQYIYKTISKKQEQFAK
jgi:shikimate kinase